MLAPIVLFVYNRPEHTSKTLNALGNNLLAADSELYIYSDAPKSKKDIQSVNEVRTLIKSFKSNEKFAKVEIIERKENFGLAKSIKAGVSDILNIHDSIIVLEDDLITSKNFLEFMNDSISYYRSNPNVGSISAYSPVPKPKHYEHDVYLVQRSCSLGWATWKEVWNNIDWQVLDFEKFISKSDDVKKFNQCGNDRAARLVRQVTKGINSWSIVFGYSLFRNNLYTLYSADSRVLNIGDDGSGVHDSLGAKYNKKIVMNKKYSLTDVVPDSDINKMFFKVYSGGYLSQIHRALKLFIFKHTNLGR